MIVSTRSDSLSLHQVVFRQKVVFLHKVFNPKSLANGSKSVSAWRSVCLPRIQTVAIITFTVRRTVTTMPPKIRTFTAA